MSEEEGKPQQIAARKIETGQVIQTPDGRGYVTGVNAAENSTGSIILVVITFVANDVTHKRSFDPEDLIEVLWSDGSK